MQGTGVYADDANFAPDLEFTGGISVSRGETAMGDAYISVYEFEVAMIALCSIPRTQKKLMDLFKDKRYQKIYKSAYTLSSEVWKARSVIVIHLDPRKLRQERLGSAIAGEFWGLSTAGVGTSATSSQLV